MMCRAALCRARRQFWWCNEGYAASSQRSGGRLSAALTAVEKAEWRLAARGLAHLRDRPGRRGRLGHCPQALSETAESLFSGYTEQKDMGSGAGPGKTLSCWASSSPSMVRLLSFLTPTLSGYGGPLVPSSKALCSTLAVSRNTGRRCKPTTPAMTTRNACFLRILDP